VDVVTLPVEVGSQLDPVPPVVGHGRLEFVQYTVNLDDDGVVKLDQLEIHNGAEVLVVGSSGS